VEPSERATESRGKAHKASIAYAVDAVEIQVLQRKRAKHGHTEVTQPRAERHVEVLDSNTRTAKSVAVHIDEYSHPFVSNISTTEFQYMH
jgi:hypothetical protein